MEFKYEEFTGRRRRENTDRVFRINPGAVFGVLGERGGVTLEEWEQDPEPVNRPGRDARGLICPAWWYQGADHSLKPDWPECMQMWGKSFPECPSFPAKEKCWEK